MYVVSEDTAGKLTETNSTIKNNLKTWVNQYRMINDTVDILDPFILNFGIEFVVRPQTSSDKFIVLDNCIEALQEHYKQPFFIGEPLYISDIYKVLKDVVGVLDVLKVKVFSNSGGQYSTSSLDFDENISSDGSYLAVPNNAILELKFPEIDIVGKLK